MNAVEFIKERNRMCKSFYDPEDGSCGDCPAKWDECDEMRVMVDDEPDVIVEIVEKWSVAHPRKTRRDVLLAQWPDATPEKIAPCYITGKCDYSKRCGDCYKAFWNQVVE